MNYNQFSSQLSKGDYSRSNLFEVVINLPATGFTEMRFMIKAASLPGKQLGEAEVKRFGANFKMANDMIVDTFPITVICHEDMRERQFFDAWISTIHGYSEDSSIRSGDLYRMGYYDEYKTSVSVIKLDRKLNPIYAIDLEEAWPNSMGPVDLSWDNSEVSTFTVNFTYRNWRQPTKNWDNSGLTELGDLDYRKYKEDWGKYEN